ncbi:MAG: DsbA family protein [Nitrospirae bacterium]|nr:DsbA family protein [Nitrospirota bacterium]
MTPPVSVYSDFNCPFCYALNERLTTSGLTEGIAWAWRGIQHAPHLPVPMAPWRGDMAEALRREVETVRRLVPDLPITVPLGKPNTAQAIRAVALALDMDPQGGKALKNALYRAFWNEGTDLSDPVILDHLAWTTGLAGMSFTALDSRLIAATTSRWQRDWERTGSHAVPTLSRQDGAQLVGFAGWDQIMEFFQPCTGTD